MRTAFFLCLGLLLMPWDNGIAQMSRQELMNSLTNAYTGILRMEHADDQEGALKAILSRKGVSDEELSSALIQIVQDFASATNTSDACIRNFALDSLGQFGTANSMPFLWNLIVTGDGGFSAINAFVELGVLHIPEAGLPALSSALKTTDNIDLHKWVYHLISSYLEYASISPSVEERERLCSFLLDATTFETQDAEHLDRLLCRVDPSYQESARRLQFASRMAILEHSNGQNNGYFSDIESQLLSSGVAHQNSEGE